MSNYENQQKRIAFLAIHRDLMGHIKPQLSIDAKAYEELCELAFVSVENLFKKYLFNGETKEKITKTNGEDLPL